MPRGTLVLAMMLVAVFILESMLGVAGNERALVRSARYKAPADPSRTSRSLLSTDQGQNAFSKAMAFRIGAAILEENRVLLEAALRRIVRFIFALTAWPGIPSPTLTGC